MDIITEGRCKAEYEKVSRPFQHSVKEYTSTMGSISFSGSY